MSMDRQQTSDDWVEMLKRRTPADVTAHSLGRSVAEPNLVLENARLRDVNHELLQALKGIVGQAGYKSLWPGSRMTIEQAIAKAEGRA